MYIFNGKIGKIMCLVINVSVTTCFKLKILQT